MFVIDLPTVVTCSFIAHVVCALFLVRLRCQTRGRFGGDRLVGGVGLPKFSFDDGAAREAA